MRNKQAAMKIESSQKVQPTGLYLLYGFIWNEGISNKRIFAKSRSVTGHNNIVLVYEILALFLMIFPVYKRSFINHKKTQQQGKYL